MKSATELKNLHKRIELLKGQLTMVHAEIKELDAKEKKLIEKESGTNEKI